jgi:Glycosyltransferase family 87
MIRISFCRLLECLVVALLATLFAWKGIWAGWHTLDTDFPQYYVVARLVAQHSCLDRIYDWVWLQRAADHAGVTHQLVGFSGLTPFSALPILPFVSLQVLEAKRAWIALNLGVLIFSVQLLRSATGLSLLRTWLIALLAVIPLRTSFALGQMHLVVCALLIAGCYFHVRGKQVASGCCIAIAGALKIYPLFFCLYFLIKRRWRALGAMVIISAFSVVLCYGIFGLPAMSAYFGEQLPRTMQGEGNNPFLWSATSSSAMFHRLFLYEPELNQHPLISSLRLYVALYPFWQGLLAAPILLAIRPHQQSRDRETLEWCAFLSLLLFLSTAPATYHFVALIAVAVPTYAILWRDRKLSAAMFLIAYFIAANASNLRFPLSPGHPSIFVTKLWAGVGLILIYTWLLARTPRESTVQMKVVPEMPLNRAKSPLQKVPPYAGAVVLIAAIWLGGSLSAWHHLQSLAIDNSRKLPPVDEGWLRTTPQETSAGLFYLAMLHTGYHAMRDGTPASANADGDELSFAVDRKGRELWIESADRSGSRITRSALRDRASGGCVINDAESPALSADENTLAFIRESSGHGSLWMTDPRTCAHGLNAEAIRVTPQSVDVRALNALQDGRFTISAVTSRGAGVYIVSRAGTVQQILQSSLPYGWSAISADGGRLVASQLIANHWQLVTVNLSSHAQKQLTFSDCNSEAPEWKDSRTVLFATDCERGNRLTTLAEIRVEE